MVIIQKIARFIGAPVVICIMLTQCAWLIPSEQSVPRFNKVLGEPRRPELNVMMGAQPASLSPVMPVTPLAEVQPQPQSMNGAPVALTSPVYPPVSNETKARVDEIVAREVPPPVGMPLPYDTIRRTPLENSAVDGMAIAQSNYPTLNAVPPSPAIVDAESAARLQRVRAQLEQERALTNTQRIQLDNDVAAQPSLLRDPVNLAPAIQPVQPAPSITVPSPVVPRVTGSLPPPPSPLASAAISNRYVPPAAPSIQLPVANIAVPTNQSFAISPVPQPIDMPMQEPIVLRAPAAAIVMAPSSVVASSGVQSAASSMAPAVSGGFNPLAGGDATNQSYSSNSYLPPSRYSQRRSY